MPKFLTENRVFLAIIILGIALRILALPMRDFWFDEAFTYHIAKLPIKDLVLAVASDNNPPLYYLIMHFIVKISQNELFLRLPSLFSNLAIIPVLFIFLKKHFGKTQAIVAASLFLLSPLSIYSATEARLHSFAILMLVLLTFSFFEFIRRSSTKNRLLFLFTGLVGIYSHYYITLLFLPFSLIIIFQKGTRFFTSRWLALLFFLSLAFLPWVILNLKTSHNSCFCPNSLLSLPAVLASPSLAGVGVVTLRGFIQLPWATQTFLALTALFSFYFFLRGLTKDLKLTTIYLIPLIILSFLGLFFPIFSPKAFSIFSPIFFAVTAFGITNLKNFNKISYLIYFFLAAISLIQITNPFFSGEKLKTVVEITAQDRNSLVAHTSLHTFYSTNFYTRQEQKNVLITQNPLAENTVRLIGGEKTEIDKNVESFWLVDSEKWVNKKVYSDTKMSILKQFEIKKEYQLGSISVLYLKRR